MANVLTFTPLMRQTIGFDRLNDVFETLLDDTPESFDKYPPYNIEKLDDEQYRIVMAVAGFSMNDLSIVLHDGTLTVSGQKDDKSDEQSNVQFLHRGIGARSFEHTFRLADYIKVTEADMRDGLLMINLVREVPEDKKPQMIPINCGSKLLSKKKKN